MPTSTNSRSKVSRASPSCPVEPEAAHLELEQQRIDADARHSAFDLSFALDQPRQFALEVPGGHMMNPAIEYSNQRRGGEQDGERAHAASQSSRTQHDFERTFSPTSIRDVSPFGLYFYLVATR